MRDIITSKAFYIPLLIATTLWTLWIFLQEKYEVFKTERIFDLYLLFVMTTTVTVEAFLLGQI